MFVRTSERATEVWPRFELPSEGFEVGSAGRLFRARAVAAEDRPILLFHELASHLASTLSVEVADLRRGRSWRGAAVSRESARNAVGEARVALARHAGVEITFHDREDQLTLTPHLEVVVYSWTARWYYLLRGAGLHPFASLHDRSWRLRCGEFPEAPALDMPLGRLVERLGLAPS